MFTLGELQVLVSTFVSPILGGLTIAVLAAVGYGSGRNVGRALIDFHFAGRTSQRGSVSQAVGLLALPGSSPSP